MGKRNIRERERLRKKRRDQAYRVAENRRQKARMRARRIDTEYRALERLHGYWK